MNRRIILVIILLSFLILSNCSKLTPTSSDISGEVGDTALTSPSVILPNPSPSTMILPNSSPTNLRTRIHKQESVI
jgi:hypothetical protein